MSVVLHDKIKKCTLDFKTSTYLEALTEISGGGKVSCMDTFLCTFATELLELPLLQ